MTITELLEIKAGSKVAVIGCGGKTSLINLLAAQNRDKKVLVSPTTQMMPMPMVTVLKDLDACLSHRARSGVQQMGLADSRTGKLRSLPLDVLQDITGEFDLSLLEADGSAGKPMKGWREYEPVVPSFCTHTVGVCPISALGLPLSSDYVHRPDCFARLTGLAEGDTVGITALADMVCAKDGMFWNATGKLFLVVNQVQSASQKEQAAALLEMIHKQQPGRFAGLVQGSVHRDEWTKWM